MSIVYGRRPDCDAGAHDTVWAYDEWRCRCPLAVAAKNRRRGPRTRPVDPARVDAAVRGEKVRLSVTERRLAIATLADRPVAHVAAVLQLHPSTVYLHRRQVTTWAA